MPPQDSPLHHLTADFEECDLPSDFAGISLCENQMLMDSEARTSSQSLTDDKDLSENVRQITSPRNAGKNVIAANLHLIYGYVDVHLAA